MKWLLSIVFLFSSVAFGESSETSPQQSTFVNSDAVPTEVVQKEDSRKESDIPLNLENAKKGNSEGNSVFRILFSMSILGLLGTGAFVFVKKYSVPRTMKHQTQIKILQQHFLGPKKSIAIVRVAGESLLIGITDQNISMLKSLSLLDDEVPEENPIHFDNELGRITQRHAQTDSYKTSRDAELEEEFSISGIKDVVSKRLKGFRNL